MIKIDMNVTPALDRRNIESLNRRITPAFSRGSISGAGSMRVNVPGQARPAAAHIPQTQVRQPDMIPPRLVNPAAKGQKVALNIPQGADVKLSLGFGWNVKNPECDIDASAFLIGENGKVSGDEWFVFYGQEISPDGSVEFSSGAQGDRERLTVNIRRVHPQVKRIVFVVTIHEALERRLNFSMVKDAYVRVMDGERELVSFMLNEYYESAASMTMAELYLHNGQWKFNPVGNGVNRDLAGQCAVYGVQIR